LHALNLWLLTFPSSPSPCWLLVARFYYLIHNPKLCALTCNTSIDRTMLPMNKICVSIVTTTLLMLSTEANLRSDGPAMENDQEDTQRRLGPKEDSSGPFAYTQYSPSAVLKGRVISSTGSNDGTCTRDVCIGKVHAVLESDKGNSTNVTVSGFVYTNWNFLCSSGGPITLSSPACTCMQPPTGYCKLLPHGGSTTDHLQYVTLFNGAMNGSLINVSEASLAAAPFCNLGSGIVTVTCGPPAF
jgi:hypothetical protein